jgi:hypothetical protein
MARMTDVTAALSNLHLTDFDGLREGAVDAGDPECTGQLCDGNVNAFCVLKERATLMASLGAKIDELTGLPFNNVSGFAKSASESILNPIDVIPPGCNVGLLLWGSPHPNPSSCDRESHGCFTTGATYKTNAFESMAWLAPSGFICMPFPQKYVVEFFQPQQPAAAQRILVVSKAYVREYVPMTSSNTVRYPISGATKDSVMVACLVPPRFLESLAWMPDGQLDLGLTLLNVLAALTPFEKGVALGCYDLSCEMEIVAAGGFEDCDQKPFWCTSANNVFVGGVRLNNPGGITPLVQVNDTQLYAIKGSKKVTVRENVPLTRKRFTCMTRCTWPHP